MTAPPPPRREEIPDDDVSRLVDFPHKYSPDQELIWENLLQFPGGRCESVVWRKYAPNDGDVHQIGRDREAQKKEQKPEFAYVGFVSAEVRDIRGIQTSRGHGFTVDHEPSEGQHHAHICYKRVDPDEKLKPADKQELKLAIKSCFGELVRAEGE